MKIIRSIVLLVLIHTNVHAETCRDYSHAATSIMEARYRGVLLDDVIDVVSTHRSDKVSQYLKDIAIKAYSKSIYDSKRSQYRVIRDFEDEVYSHCLNSVSMITSMEPFRDRFIGATLGSVYWSHPGIGLMEPPQDRPNGATRHRFFPSN